MSCNEKGKTPGFSTSPSIVNVFPEVVWPYINIEELYPSNTFLTRFLQHFLYTSSVESHGEKILSIYYSINFSISIMFKYSDFTYNCIYFIFEVFQVFMVNICYYRQRCYKFTIRK